MICVFNRAQLPSRGKRVAVTPRGKGVTALFMKKPYDYKVG